jgi:uncharacterized repeat protein (TIGR04138 family)
LNRPIYNGVVITAFESQPAMANDTDLLTVVRQTKYPLDAFLFVQRALEFTVKRVHGEAVPEAEPVRRHVTGQMLCQGIRDFAIEQYGLLAKTVLRRWRIQASQDFGHIVFAMVDAGLMNKTEEDSIRDFVDVFDFAEAFGAGVQLSESNT